MKAYLLTYLLTYIYIYIYIYILGRLWVLKTFMHKAFVSVLFIDISKTFDAIYPYHNLLRAKEWVSNL